MLFALAIIRIGSNGIDCCDEAGDLCDGRDESGVSRFLAENGGGGTVLECARKLYEWLGLFWIVRRTILKCLKTIRPFCSESLGNESYAGDNIAAMNLCTLRKQSGLSRTL